MNITYVLIIFAHVGFAGEGNSNALTSVPGFYDLAECQAAGKEARKLGYSPVKIIDYICVKQSRRTGL